MTKMSILLLLKNEKFDLSDLVEIWSGLQAISVTCKEKKLAHKIIGQANEWHMVRYVCLQALPGHLRKNLTRRVKTGK